MTKGNPMNLIVKFTIPILLGNLLQLTYSIADMRIIGSFLGDEALAAVGATTVLYSLFLGFFMGMANGFAIIIARMFGGEDYGKLRTAFASSLLLGAVISILMVLLVQLFMHPVLGFLRVPATLTPMALSYIRIVMAGLVITMFYDIFLASARAVGDSFTPLLILILSIGLNIAGDLLLVGCFRTGVWGAAVATVAAQSISLLVSGIYILKKYAFFRVGKGDIENTDRHMIELLLSTGTSMGLMSSLINIGSFILQTAINSLGDSYIVAQSAARKLTEVLMSIFVAIGQALSTYSSQNYGAGNMQRIRQGMQVGYKITCTWCVIVLVIVYVGAGPLVAMITGSNDEVMIRAATDYLRIDSILYVLVAVIFVLRHTLQGVGDRITPLVSSGIEMAGKMILTYTLVPRMGYRGVILVEPIVWIVMIIPLIVRARKLWGR